MVRPAGVCDDRTRIDRKPSATEEPNRNTELNNPFKPPPKCISAAESAVPHVGETRIVWNLVLLRLKVFTVLPSSRDSGTNFFIGLARTQDRGAGRSVLSTRSRCLSAETKQREMPS
jgi:hypothetical protein